MHLAEYGTPGKSKAPWRHTAGLGTCFGQTLKLGHSGWVKFGMVRLDLSKNYLNVKLDLMADIWRGKFATLQNIQA